MSQRCNGCGYWLGGQKLAVADAIQRGCQYKITFFCFFIGSNRPTLGVSGGFLLELQGFQCVCRKAFDGRFIMLVNFTGTLNRGVIVQGAFATITFKMQAKIIGKSMRILFEIGMELVENIVPVIIKIKIEGVLGMLFGKAMNLSIEDCQFALVMQPILKWSFFIFSSS